MSFQQYNAIRKKRTFSQKMNEDMHESVSKILFECKDLGQYLADKYNDRKLFTIKTAAEVKIGFDFTFLFDFEKKYGIKEPYTFNEFKYFKNSYIEEYLISLHTSDCYLSEITFPETITLPIGGESVFAMFDHLKKVVIPENNKSHYISCDCFEGCTHLESFKIPSSVLEIKTSAFNSCIRLEEITIPDSVKVIRDYAFANDDNLKKVNFGKSLTEIREKAFSYCYNIKNIDLSKTKLKGLNATAFQGCRSLETISLPKTLEFADFSIFSFCVNLKNIFIDSKIKFKNLSNLLTNAEIIKKVRLFIPERLKNYYDNEEEFCKANLFLDEDYFYFNECKGTYNSNVILDLQKKKMKEIYKKFHSIILYLKCDI